MAKNKVEGTVEEAVEAAKNVAEDVKETARETAKKVRKTAKTTAQKTAVEAKRLSDTAKKAAAKVTLRETYIQYGGQEVKESEILEKVEAAYKAEGHRVSSIRSLELYIKPEDGAAYYVINDKLTGKIEL